MKLKNSFICNKCGSERIGIPALSVHHTYGFDSKFDGLCEDYDVCHTCADEMEIRIIEQMERLYHVHNKTK